MTRGAAAPGATDGVRATDPADGAPLVELRDRWARVWPDALALWSPYVRLRPPRWCLSAEDEQREGLTGSFAMIRLVDQTVVISIRQVAPDLAAFPLQILGHEIGHHILCPADLSDNAHLLARVRRGLPGVEEHAPTIANLYADALINDRLQRSRGLDMAGVYQALATSGDRLWTLYMRLYEILWSLPTGTLVTRGALGQVDDRLDLDAVLGARLVRSFAGRWLDGAGGFAALCLPYLLESAEHQQAWHIWQDAVAAGAGGFPAGLTEVGDDDTDPVHPAFDPELSGSAGGRSPDTTEDGAGVAGEEPREGDDRGSAGQFRQPFEYGQILRASGLALTDHEIAVRYYRERAARHLIPFPTRRAPASADELPEGTVGWDVGEPLADIDWFETALRSPVVIPGVTTVQRAWGADEGGRPERIPVDLDLYVDSSGSMPDPQVSVSYLTLAGAIVACSALRAGARVQVTLWSGAGQFTRTDGFVRDEEAVLRVLTGFFGGATAFPIHVLRDTYADRRPEDPPAHVLVVSDDGVTTLFDRDEAGRDGREVARQAVASAGGGATMVLNLWLPVDTNDALQAALDDGWDIHVVREWADLVAFAHAFSQRAYASEDAR